MDSSVASETKRPGEIESAEDPISKAVETLSLAHATETVSSPAKTNLQSPSIKHSPRHVASDRPAASPKPNLRRAPSTSSLGEKDKAPLPHLRRKSSRISINEATTPPRSPAARRSSSYNLGSPVLAGSELPTRAEQISKPVATAATVAQDFLEKDLLRHQSLFANGRRAGTVVILQDDCYGHRFSRPRTSKAGLNSIVERPERLRAAVLGVSAAYIRLGGRYKGDRAAPHPQRDTASLPLVPFDVMKTSRKVSLQSTVATAVHSAMWMAELATLCEMAESKLVSGGKELQRSEPTENASNGISKPKAKLHEGDLYLCSGSLQAFEGALGGVCEAVDAVFAKNHCRRAFVCIRPPGHHCSADLPSGFCWLNNVHVGIAYAAATHNLTHAAIIDFDLHHGDGSQAITWAHNARVAKYSKATPMTKKFSIGYFSLHDINSYPCEAGDDEKVRNASLCIENAHGQSVWNVHLQPWKTEAEFWALYETKYMVVLEKARNYLRNYSDRLRQVSTHPKPKAAIFLSAGLDASEWESEYMQRHKANVPTGFYARFTRDIVRMADEEELNVEGRVISVLEGGYSDRALMSGVLSHLCGLTEPAHSQLQPQSSSDGSRDTSISTIQEDVSVSPCGTIETQAAWWSSPSLNEVEDTISPKAPPINTKKQRSEVKPTYTSATESYKAKVVAPPPGRRSLSGSLLGQQVVPEPQHPAPPAPDVDWATATVELSKLLVPADRPTESCKPEDLTAEATRARRDRQSSMGQHVDPFTNEQPRMQLREKRTQQRKLTTELPAKLPTRASRRKTIADVKLATLDDEAALPSSDSALQDAQKQPNRRRSSVASSVTSATTEIGSEYSLSSIVESRPSRDQSRRSSAAVMPLLESGTTESAQRPDPPPRSILGAMATSSTAASKDLAASNLPSVSNAPNNYDDATSSSLDQLTTGMKKMSIKLKVPSKEEHDARERAKANGNAAGKSAKSNNPKAARAPSPKKAKAKAKPSASSKTKSKIPTNDTKTLSEVAKGVEGDEPALGTSKKSFDSTFRREMTDAMHQVADPEATLPGSIKDTSQSTETDVKPLNDTHAPITSHYDQQPGALSHTVPSTPPKQPPYASPVTVKRTKDDLPVFTSTSPITFGSRPPNEIPPGIDHTMLDADAQIRKNGSKPLAPGSSNARVGQAKDTDITQGNKKDRQTSPDEGGEDTQSIWDVPDTPQRKMN